MPVQAYYDCYRGIDIRPGMWRPHYPWEQIAWIHPAWGSQDYAWLDFPECVNCDQGIFFLSNVYPDPVIDTLRHRELSPSQWEREGDALRFDRTLPDGLRFGGMLRRADESSVAMHLQIHNGTQESLTGVRLVPCLLLRTLQGFEACTGTNKFVYLDGRGWTNLDEAHALEDFPGRFPIGDGSRRVGSPLPLVVARGVDGKRMIVMTWFDDTHSLTGNPVHPCIHAHAAGGDLEPGETKAMEGSLLFLEGSLDDVASRFSDRYPV